eukprot:365773-Chlamydomonas_euryale.AAC.6
MQEVWHRLPLSRAWLSRAFRWRPSYRTGGRLCRAAGAVEQVRWAGGRLCREAGAVEQVRWAGRRLCRAAGTVEQVKWAGGRLCRAAGAVEQCTTSWPRAVGPHSSLKVWISAIYGPSSTATRIYRIYRIYGIYGCGHPYICEHTIMALTHLVGLAPTSSVHWVFRDCWAAGRSLRRCACLPLDDLPQFICLGSAATLPGAHTMCTKVACSSFAPPNSARLALSWHVWLCPLVRAAACCVALLSLTTSLYA